MTATKQDTTPRELRVNAEQCIFAFEGPNKQLGTVPHGHVFTPRQWAIKAEFPDRCMIQDGGTLNWYPIGIWSSLVTDKDGASVVMRDDVPVAEDFDADGNSLGVTPIFPDGDTVLGEPLKPGQMVW